MVINVSKNSPWMVRVVEGHRRVVARVVRVVARAVLIVGLGVEPYVLGTRGTKSRTTQYNHLLITNSLFLFKNIYNSANI